MTYSKATANRTVKNVLAELNIKGCENGSNSVNESLKIKAYCRRWLILVVFMWYAAVNAYEWIEYTIISNIVVKYYEVSYDAVNWTAIVFMALYPPLVIPASYLIDKKGVRVAALVGCLGTFLGTALKIFSIQQDRFYVVMIGQCITAASQCVIVCLPPKLAAIWFQSHEVSTACAFGVFGTQLGNALGFIVSSAIVRDHEIMDDIAYDLTVMCWGLTIIMIPPIVGTLFFFKDKPELPPSLTQLKLRENPKEFEFKVFFRSIKELYTDKGFLLHSTAYAINNSVFSAVSSVLNDLLFPYFHNAEISGRMGLTMVTVGLIGLIIFGILLDKTRLYKEVNLVIYIMAGVSTVGMMYALYVVSEIWVYITIGLFGLFTNAYMSTSFELAMELVYPMEESITTGLTIAGSQLLGVIITLAFAAILSTWGSIWALFSQVILLIIGSILTACVPNNLKRQAAFESKSIDQKQ